MKTSTRAGIGLTALLLLAVWLSLDNSSTATRPAGQETAQPTDSAVARPTGSPAAPARTGNPSELLITAQGGDGDSWRDASGREYRLGLVNAPESGECFGPQATAERKRLVAKGFRAQTYTRDGYGRNVSVVTTEDGTSLNVDLARRGFVNDRYLKQHRHENPLLAAQLETAFTAARAERAGLWAACSSRVTASAAPRHEPPRRHRTRDRATPTTSPASR